MKLFEHLITTHPAFVNCKGKLLVQLVGGSTLYGLNNANSDVDYRGLFFASAKANVTGFANIESIVQTGDIDSAYYELTHFLKLLRKSNTQVMEILFAPDSAFTNTTPLFEELRKNALNLICSKTLKSSLKGYVFSEIRLATGERSGQLGGKRKAAVTEYGFSPKNFVQILRLCKVGIEFFNGNGYMVNVKEFDPSYHEFLMSIKENPAFYSCDELKKLVDNKYSELEKAMDESKISYNFDANLAADLVLSARSLY